MPAHKEKALDEIDRRILRALRKQARLTNNELAEIVGLSASPCWTRVKRLEEAGFIDGYVALLNQEQLGLRDTVIIEVRLDRHDEEQLQKFGQALSDLPEVLEAYLTTGDYDYYIKVAVDGTMGYEKFLRERLYKVPGIRQSRSAFVLKCLKREISPQP